MMKLQMGVVMRASELSARSSGGWVASRRALAGVFVSRLRADQCFDGTILAFLHVLSAIAA
jgi:hypothetical protein